MKNLLYSLVLFIYSCSSSVGQSNTIELSYTSLGGEKIIVKGNSFYDIESKPQTFSISYDANEESTLVALVDIYRTLDSKNAVCNNHYFETLIIPIKDGKGDINIKSMFEMNKSRFITTIGFEVRICILARNKLLKARSFGDCIISKTYSFKYDE